MRMNDDCRYHLVKAGIAPNDADALRRISMTLQRWFELECGDGDNHGSWAIERDDNGDGPPFMVRHHYLHGRGKDYISRQRLPDKEAGARRRLVAIMARYPGFNAYVQTDPRGCALYILRPDDLRDGRKADECYTNGIAVHR